MALTAVHAILATLSPSMDSTAWVRETVKSSMMHYKINVPLVSMVDIDECSLDIDLCQQNCMDTVGSYTCSCNTGYHLESDGFTCGGMYTTAILWHCNVMILFWINPGFPNWAHTFFQPRIPLCYALTSSQHYTCMQCISSHAILLNISPKHWHS